MHIRMDASLYGNSITLCNPNFAPEVNKIPYEIVTPEN